MRVVAGLRKRSKVKVDGGRKQKLNAKRAGITAITPWDLLMPFQNSDDQTTSFHSSDRLAAKESKHAPR